MRAAAAAPPPAAPAGPPVRGPRELRLVSRRYVDYGRVRSAICPAR